MPPKVALIACFCFIVALFVKEQRWGSRISVGGWIPLVWMLILGSRPLSSWLSSAPLVEGSEVYLDGSPMDRTFSLILIFAGLLILLARQVSWKHFITSNKWLALYFAYLGISVLWSDYTFVSFKRWIKDFGNILMVLIVLSEENPVAAVKAVLVRCSYVLIPLSIVFVKYFPDIGRAYNRWTGVASYSGVTLDKNQLGIVLTTLGISLIWALIELHDTRSRVNKKFQLPIYVVLLTMTIWLLSIANSSTALGCGVVGASVLLFLCLPNARRNIRRWLIWGSLAAALLFVVQFYFKFDIFEVVLQLLGRNSSLTGRTDIWDAVLKEDTNLLFGVGYFSFWMGDRVERISADYYYSLNEAHNGYLEVYLNGGFIGLALLAIMLCSTGRYCLVGLTVSNNQGGYNFRLAFLVVAVVYNFSEVIFNRQNLMWVTLLLILSRWPIHVVGSSGVKIDDRKNAPGMGLNRPAHRALPKVTRI